MCSACRRRSSSRCICKCSWFLCCPCWRSCVLPLASLACLQTQRVTEVESSAASAASTKDTLADRVRSAITKGAGGPVRIGAAAAAAAIIVDSTAAAAAGRPSGYVQLSKCVFHVCYRAATYKTQHVACIDCPLCCTSHHDNGVSKSLSTQVASYQP